MHFSLLFLWSAQAVWKDALLIFNSCWKRHGIMDPEMYREKTVKKKSDSGSSYCNK